MGILVSNCVQASNLSKNLWQTILEPNDKNIFVGKKKCLFFQILIF
jgi:hypothetical protein